MLGRCPSNRLVLLVGGSSNQHFSYLEDYPKTVHSMPPCEAVMKISIMDHSLRSQSGGGRGRGQGKKSIQFQENLFSWRGGTVVGVYGLLGHKARIKNSCSHHFRIPLLKLSRWNELISNLKIEFKWYSPIHIPEVLWTENNFRIRF